MLKEEKEFREYLRAAVRYKCHFTKATNKEMYDLITNLKSVMLEDAANIAESSIYSETHNDFNRGHNLACVKIAAAIRGRG